ncbi:unnamed protein product [Amoebophrya sp. A120]|nr:unnamed protein product [Amoebophrya sp. A120]CAD7944352.1 unnamed protein product [Amoebophrya sp. A120]|eukprot:GSA120T00015697001.1
MFVVAALVFLIAVLCLPFPLGASSWLDTNWLGNENVTNVLLFHGMQFILLVTLLTNLVQFLVYTNSARSRTTRISGGDSAAKQEELNNYCGNVLIPASRSSDETGVNVPTTTSTTKPGEVNFFHRPPPAGGEDAVLLSVMQDDPQHDGTSRYYGTNGIFMASNNSSSSLTASLLSSRNYRVDADESALHAKINSTSSCSKQSQFILPFLYGTTVLAVVGLVTPAALIVLFDTHLLQDPRPRLSQTAAVLGYSALMASCWLQLKMGTSAAAAAVGDHDPQMSLSAKRTSADEINFVVSESSLLQPNCTAVSSSGQNRQTATTAAPHGNNFRVAG